MNYVLKSILLISISCNMFAARFTDIQSIKDDFNNLNKSCESDKCSSSNKRTSPLYTCDCDINCVKFGTCCLESPYMKAELPEVEATCRSVYNGGTYFMIDSCPTSDTVWNSLCHDEWKFEDDVMKIVPVTSLFTNLTYKNYFCFRCHEENDRFLYWNVKIDSKDSKYNISDGSVITDSEKQDFALKFDGKWVIALRNNSLLIPVKLSFEIPQELTPLLKMCDSNVIYNCSTQWIDKSTTAKCQAYMGIRNGVRKGLSFVTYKNLHCALCNFEILNSITCIFEKNVEDRTRDRPRDEDRYRAREEDRYRPRDENRYRPREDDRRDEDRHRPIEEDRRDKDHYRPKEEDSYRPREEDRYIPREDDRGDKDRRRPIEEDRRNRDRYRPREDDRYRSREEDSYRPREKDSYIPREDDRGDKDRRRPIELDRRNRDRYRPREDDRYRPREEDSYRPREEDRYIPREDDRGDKTRSRPDIELDRRNRDRYSPREDDRYRPREDDRYRPREDDRYRPREEDRYRPRDEDRYRPRDEDHYIPKQVFTFAYLLDVNNSDGDRVGKIQKCEGYNIWDPFAKKCRKLTCALSGYKLVNGKCRLE